MVQVNWPVVAISIANLATAPPNLWTGLQQDNDTTTILFGRHCPPNYCNLDIGPFPLNGSLSHISCLNNRAGVLCGQCKKHYSAAFGSATCYAHCKNLYLLSIPVYALAGLLLVMTLFALRLTVATGTINGVIFYANTLGLVMDKLTEGSGKIYVKMIHIIISLLNLNLGFPMCLYKGMSPSDAVGFQFVFPVYLWSLVIGMVIISKYSIKLSNLISKSSVQVLATLFYLSFSLLVRTTIDVVTSTTIQLSIYNSHSYQNETKLVWFYDGLEYGHGLHGLYLVLVMLFVLLFLFPFTIFTTFFYYLVRFDLVNKMRPFLDAYGGPFKDKWRFWFGLRLWITIILSSVSGAMQGSNANIMFVVHLGIIGGGAALRQHEQAFFRIAHPLRAFGNLQRPRAEFLSHC